MNRTLFLVNPPERKGYSNERSQSAGLGVSRRLKPWENDFLFLPPPDMMLVAAVAEQQGLNVHVVDFLLDRLPAPSAHKELEKRIEQEAAKDKDAELWIGLRLSIPTLLVDLAFAETIKKRFPRSKLFLFGVVVMSTVDHWIGQTSADAILYGEPEAIVGGMFAAAHEWKTATGVIDPKTFLPMKGEALFDGSLQSRYKDWVLVDNLAEVPFPAYHLLPLERYSLTGKTEDCFVYVTASRGCPIGCTMCPYMLHEGRPLRISTADRVVQEMAWLNKTWGIHKWRFRDPNFGFNRKLVREILTKVVDQNIKMSATVEVSLEVVDDPLIELMAKAGVKTITTGIETADAACMESIGQKLAINDKLRQKIAVANALGIHVYGTFVIGAPEETWDSVERTIDYSKTMECECTFTIMTPFPGTPMYYRALEEGLLNREMTYDKWDSYTPTVRSRHLTTSDLALARWWARLELIVPYRLAQAKREGGSAYRKQWAKLVPRQLALRYVRAAVASRRRKGSPTVMPPANFTDRKLEKIPLSLRSE